MNLTSITVAGRACVGAAALLTSLSASASLFELTYTGTFNSTEGLYASGTPQTTFAAVTPFSVRAVFDDASPNQAPPFFDGFRAYVPTSATIDILGQTYSIETAAQNAGRGVSVAIFDPSQVFYPGFYGVGLIADVVADGAGFVGDFAGASPAFSVDSLVPTTFTGYRGVGHGSGTCVSGMPPGCSHYITPWVLRDASGAAFDLLINNYEEVIADGSYVVNTATITAVPEPATAAMLGGGLLLLLAARRRADAVPNRS